MSAPRYFRTPAAFRRWLARHHASAAELWVGYYKKGTGTPSITWPESVDEALCFGWIDGIRKSVDEDRYVIRFTPRRPASHWSAVNLRRVRALIAEGRMTPAGLAAFDRRRAEAPYSYQQRPRALPAAYRAALQARAGAWEFFRAQPPGYRRTATAWVMSARREETRRRRLETLVRHSAKGERIPPLQRPARKK